VAEVNARVTPSANELPLRVTHAATIKVGASFCCIRKWRKIAFILQKSCAKIIFISITRARVKKGKKW